MDGLNGALTGLLAMLAASAALAQEAPAGGAPAGGDPALGERVFAKCRACHQIGEGARNAVGPVLNGVIGRRSASLATYSYSDAMKQAGWTWDEATFKDYIKDPKAKVPGTKMAFAGLTKQSEIDNITAYLKSFDAEGRKVP